ncbi:DUF6406 domain-containing protein [Streptomyces sp. NPDC050636]|uniref:DUF6406 domain-containing protein n=1 Tax=Streptomyces sp. NPDC050636 TaxID=3154510 RepID=UPI0034253CC6
MNSNEIVLGEGIQRNTSFGSFAVTWVDLRPDHPLTVHLRVVTDEMRKYVLAVGETFPVGNETWKIASFEDAPGYDWMVRIARVDPPPVATSR